MENKLCVIPRVRPARSPTNIDMLRDSTQTTPETSLRRRVLNNELNVSYSSVRRILKFDLIFKNYIIQHSHILTERDMTSRVEMAEEFLARIETDPEWIRDVWFSNESHFHLSGKVNKNHCIF